MMEKTFFNELIVVKRSGQRVNFNGPKIAVAIKAAFDDDDSDIYNEKDINKVYEDTLKYIYDNYQDRKTINVEDIQDVIEKILLLDKYLPIYKHFSDYRIKRSESRKAFSEKQQHKFVKAIEKIGSINSNDDKPFNALYSFGQTISSEYSRSYILDNKYIRAHDEGKISIHNMSYFTLGFLGDTHIIIDNYLKNESDFLCLLDFLNNVKQEICGEIALDDFDEILNDFALNKFKFILKNKLSNYLKVSGFFDFINFKKIEDSINKIDDFKIDLNVFGQIYENRFTRNILEVAYNDSVNFIKQFLSENLNKIFISINDKNQKYMISFGKLEKHLFIQDIIIKEISKLKRLNNVCFIYKTNKLTSLSIIEKVSSLVLNEKNIMVQYDEDLKNINYFSNGLRIFENNNSQNISNGRANIAITSINLARLGIKYKSLSNEFYKELDDLLELVKNELIFVFELIGDKCKENYQYLFNGNILDDEKLEYGQKIRKVIKNGTLNINLIGLKECSSVINSDYKNIQIQLLEYINHKLIELTKDHKYNFTLSFINYDDSSSSMIELDKSIFGLIPKITKKDKYEDVSLITNLTTLSSELKNVSNLQKYLNGGVLLNLIITPNINSKKLADIILKVIENKINITSFRIAGDKP